MKNIIVGQSGGPTAVINSSVAGVYKKAKELGVEHVYGMVYGIEGFLNENIIDLDDYLNNDENYELISDKLFYYIFKELLPNEEIENIKLGYGFNCMMKYFLESLLKSGFYEASLNIFLSRDDINQQNFISIIYFFFFVLSGCEENFVKKHNYNIIINSYTFFNFFSYFFT